MIFFIIFIFNSLSKVQAAYTEECNPIIKITKIINCKNPYKECLVQFKVKCDAFPEWINCKIKPDDVIEAKLAGLEKAPKIGSQWHTKYALYCQSENVNCNSIVWTVQHGTGSCRSKKKTVDSL